MNSNWRTPEEAKGFFCHMNSGPCISDACAYWHWRPCPACRGRGTTDCYEWDEGLKKDKVQICGYCNGTGTDGSGLGRCGLIRG